MHASAMTPHQKYLQDCRKRRDKMRAMRDQGKTLEEIATHFGISRQRVDQLINKKEPAQ